MGDHARCRIETHGKATHPPTILCGWRKFCVIRWGPNLARQGKPARVGDQAAQASNLYVLYASLFGRATNLTRQGHTRMRLMQVLGRATNPPEQYFAILYYPVGRVTNCRPTSQANYNFLFSRVGHQAAREIHPCIKTGLFGRATNPARQGQNIVFVHTSSGGVP